jgi:8-oxo-dGTP pyrophosphatase MutT (NUDIX family)
MSVPPAPPSSELLRHLKAVLIDLHHHPYPPVPNPPHCKKRASIALIIRVHPSYNSWPDPSPTSVKVDTSTPKGDVVSRLQDFFDRPWVKHGEPEVLFIKRAARLGDRWNSHVALPGGKRDPGDASDRDVAIRETWEEVGIDLRREEVLCVGNLSERVVTTEWGTVP